jgi:hypothetical protein
LKGVREHIALRHRRPLLFSKVLHGAKSILNFAERGECRLAIGKGRLVALRGCSVLLRFQPSGSEQRCEDARTKRPDCKGCQRSALSRHIRRHRPTGYPA